MGRKHPLTVFSEEFKQKYGWGHGWDDPRPRALCLHCHGTGHAGGHWEDPTECGFCYTEEEEK